MKQLFLLSLLLLSLASCQDFQKSQYISDYEKFVEEVDKNYQNYTKEQKTEADNKYKMFSESKFNELKDVLTPEEKGKINKLSGRYLAIVAKSEIQNLGDEFKDLMQKAEGVLEEINK